MSRWELVPGKSVIKDEYLAAIRAADGGDERPLRELHQRFTRVE